MSVYKSAKSRFYQYDFQYKGRRFHGSTGVETLRKAEAVERKLRDDAAQGRLGDGAQLTLNQAAGKWWAERGQDLADGKRRAKDTPSPLEQRLERLLELFGPAIRIVDIDQACVAAAVEKRRRQVFTRSAEKGATPYLPANATVNKQVIDTLRPILKRAATHWGAKALPAIDWGELRLDEPRGSVRIYTPAQVERWMAEAKRTGWYDGLSARPDAADLSLALDLILTYGLRVNELFFQPATFDAEGRRLVWLKGRKRDVLHVVPLLDHHALAIQARLGRAIEADLAHIWFYERWGRLIAISKAGLTERLNNAAARANVPPGRLLHGGRHHAGTAFQRKHKNARLTQQLLGHIDPKSTAIYVHLDDTDLRAALESKSEVTVRRQRTRRT